MLTSARPAQGQSTAPAALTPTPTATPITPPSSPNLVAPADGSTTSGANFAPLGMPTFTWSLPPGANYSHIQVSNTPGFSVLRVDEDTAATTSTPKDVWPDGVYFWRVKAATGPANKRVWGEYSALHSFTKDWGNSSSIRPSLLQPPVDAVRSSFILGDFAWTPVAGAAGYLFEIATDELLPPWPTKRDAQGAAYNLACALAAISTTGAQRLLLMPLARQTASTAHPVWLADSR